MNIKKDLKIFSDAGIILPKYVIAERGPIASSIFPAPRYVIKAYGKEIVHKTDMGAIKADIEREGIDVEMRRMRNKLSKFKVEGFLVQEQAPKGVEVIIGAKRDRQFGDVIMFGLGGVYVELYKDVSVRLCPITTEDALEMIDETKAGMIFSGFRGSEPIDRYMIAGVMKKVCTIMHSNPDIQEIDLNPVILYPKSYVAVDVRVIR